MDRDLLSATNDVVICQNFARRSQEDSGTDAVISHEIAGPFGTLGRVFDFP